MASQFNTVRRHRAFLALTVRAGLKAFTVVFRAGITVVLKQRNGVINLFCTANGRLHTRQLHRPKRDCCRKSSFFHTASSYSCDSLIAAVGQTFAAGAENAAPKVELPRQLIGDQIGFYRQRVRRARVHTGRTADALLRIMFRFATEVLSTAIGSSGYDDVGAPVLMTF